MSRLVVASQLEEVCRGALESERGEGQEREGSGRSRPPLSWPCGVRTSVSPYTLALVSSGLTQHLVPDRLELCPRIPFGVVLTHRDPVADHEEELGVLDCATQIPIGFDLIRWLVVVVFGVLRPLLLTIALGLPDELYP